MFDFSPPDIDWSSITPVIIVAVTGMITLIMHMFGKNRGNSGIVAVTSLGLLGAATSLVMQFGEKDLTSFAGMVYRDRFGLIMQLLCIVGCFTSVLFSESYLKEKRIAFGEFYPLVTWSTCGAMIMSSTQNLLMVFLGLEVLSIALYVLAGMSRNEDRSEESAMKYFLLGAFASSFLLYGIAFIYGGTGSLHLGAITSAWMDKGPNSQIMLIFGMGLLLVGLSFKAGFVPFHQWTPDVYQGAPTNVTAFMAAASKVGALAALWRVLDGFHVITEYWMPVMFWVAILTMTVGNLIAVTQKDIKRTLGYSSIAHAGYILVGVLAHFKDPQEVGFTSISYYLLSYVLMTVGSFAVISLAAKGSREGTRFQDLYGLWNRAPFAAGTLIVFVASLIGIPPMSGFFGKLLIFNDALTAGLTPLAIVLAVNSIISCYYYLGMVRAVFVADDESNQNTSATMSPGLASTCLLCATGVVVIAVMFTPVVDFLQSPKAPEKTPAYMDSFNPNGHLRTRTIPPR